jgi:2-polyprenyl-6-methoxyphenol hydroxylase-like FAD-dependent oxidoreductase
MSENMVDTDVLIVGAGPVGLFLANECARRGLRYRLIEMRPIQSIHSKALAIFPRTMEIFDMAGVVGPFLEAANRVTSVAVLSGDRSLAHMEFAPEETPYGFVAMVPQDVTEKLLLQELRRKGGNVEYETAFVSAAEEDGAVKVEMEQRGRPTRSRARFVIGCDGAHSAVRHTMKLSFEGEAYEDLYMLADVDTNGSLPADEMQLCPSERGPLAIFPMSANRKRVVATIDHQEGEAPTLETVQRVLNERGPKGVEAQSMRWGSYFKIHHRHVTQLRSGKFFLAGDAAHIHSPFGGQGMNTGLHDAWNLAWKLDLCLRGLGNNALLDSYSAERIPVIRSVIDTTHRLTRVMGTPSKFAQVLRDTMIPMVSRLAPFQHAFVRRMSELGIDYQGSPIVEGPGKRYFEKTLCGGQGIGRRFLLMIGADEDAAGKEALVRFCDSFREVAEPRTTEQPGVTLVRPDGYIAFAAHHSTETIREALRSVLERHLSEDQGRAAAV